MEVTDRIAEYLEKTGQSVLSLEKSIGTRSTIQSAIKNRSNLGVDWIKKILLSQPDLNPVWLILGKGPMLLSELDKEHMIREAQLEKKIRDVFHQEMKPMLADIKKTLLMNHTEHEHNISKLMQKWTT